MLRGHKSGVSFVAVSGDGRLGATASPDASVRLFNLESGTMLHLLEGHAGMVTSAAFSPDASACVTTGLDGAVVAWWVDGSRDPDVAFDLGARRATGEDVVVVGRCARAFATGGDVLVVLPSAAPANTSSSADANANANAPTPTPTTTRVVIWSVSKDDTATAAATTAPVAKLPFHPESVVGLPLSQRVASVERGGKSVVLAKANETVMPVCAAAPDTVVRDVMEWSDSLVACALVGADPATSHLLRVAVYRATSGDCLWTSEQVSLSPGPVRAVSLVPCSPLAVVASDTRVVVLDISAPDRLRVWMFAVVWARVTSRGASAYARAARGVVPRRVFEMLCCAL